jgi:hypothetical protein
VYDYKSQSIRLLDDGSGLPEPFERYDFGSCPEMLFLPKEMRIGRGKFQSLAIGECCFIKDDGTAYCCDPIIRLPKIEEAVPSTEVNIT